MSEHPGSLPSEDWRRRAESERNAYNDGTVSHRYREWAMKAPHVFDCPNSLRIRKLYDERIHLAGRGGRALELGCADGGDCLRLLDAGAEYVCGIDVSERNVADANARRVPGKLEFMSTDAMAPIPGTFNVIFGQAILHHLDWRVLLPRLYRNNLLPGGRMVFLEPLGANLILRIYRRISKSAHTLHEIPFYARDLRWLRRTFPGTQIIPRNYLSLVFGILSSRCFPSADNGLMRLCDRVDWWLGQNVRCLVPRFRQAVIEIRKPPARGPLAG